MPQVHPTALVDANVQLADDVVVGPWSCIRGRVAIGAGTRICERVTIQGPLTLGEANVVYPNACLGFAPQDRKFDPNDDGPGVTIGHRNILREGVTIHRATGARPTAVGDDNYLMVNSHLGHDVQLGSHVTMGNGTLIAGHVEIGDRVVFGGNSAIHQFCRVGRLTMVSGVNGATQDLPPFCVLYSDRTVGSLNLVGLRRNGLRAHIKPLKHAFEILYRTRLPRDRVVAEIRQALGNDPLCAEFADFIETSRRGITPYGGSRGVDTADADDPVEAAD